MRTSTSEQIFIQLKVSQASAEEQFDEQLASQFEERGSNDIVQMNSTHGGIHNSTETTYPYVFILYEELAFADGVYSLVDRESYFPNCAVSIVTTSLLFLPLILWF